MHSLRRLYASRWFRLAASGVLLLLVCVKARPDRLAAAVGSAQPRWLGLALLLTFPFLYLKALRWYIMLRAAAIDVSFGEASFSLIGGMGLGLVTPGRLGEIARVAYLRDGQKMKIAGLVLVDKGLDVLVLALLSVAGAWASFGGWSAAALLLAAAAGLLLVYRPGLVARCLAPGSRRVPGRSVLERAWSGVRLLSAGHMTVLLVLTAASFAVVLFQFGVILLSWHSWSLGIVFLTFPLVVLTNVLPITVGGLGVREGAAALLLSHYGVSPAHAALAAFLMFAMNTALPGIVGAALLPAVSPGTRVANPKGL